MSGGGATPGYKGVEEVVVARVSVPGDNFNSGLGGGDGGYQGGGGLGGDVDGVLCGNILHQS